MAGKHRSPLHDDARFYHKLCTWRLSSTLWRIPMYNLELTNPMARQCACLLYSLLIEALDADGSWPNPTSSLHVLDMISLSMLQMLIISSQIITMDQEHSKFVLATGFQHFWRGNAQKERMSVLWALLFLAKLRLNEFSGSCSLEKVFLTEMMK